LRGRVVENFVHVNVFQGLHFLFNLWCKDPLIIKFAPDAVQGQPVKFIKATRLRRGETDGVEKDG